MPQRDHYDDVVGELLTEFREELGLTQGDVAETIGLTTAQVGRMERTGRMQLSDFMRLALVVYGQHPSDLIKRVERRLLESADIGYVNPYRYTERR